MADTDTVTADEITGALRALGVAPGQLLVVHSSLSTFGQVAGGADAVVEALLRALSPGGTLFVPTFTYGRLPFDPATTPSCDGAITEAVRRRSDAVRSRHPTHSLAGVGPDAGAILEGHERTTPFGPGSPLWRLWERNAWVLLVGVGNFANSMMHVAEELLDVPYLDRRRMAKVRTPDGGVRELEVRRPGCSDAWDFIEPTFRARGFVRDGHAGASKLMAMPARAVVDTTADVLRANPAALLCNAPGCDACEEARRMLSAQR